MESLIVVVDCAVQYIQFRRRNMVKLGSQVSEF
jgi:hypothetical protein